MAGIVRQINRVVLAIREQVIALYIAADTGKLTVRIDEPSHGRIVIPALEEVEPGFGIVVIPAVTQGIECADVGVGGVSDIQQLAPWVVGITHDLRAGINVQADHIALQIPVIVVSGTIQFDRNRSALIVVIERQHPVAGLFGQQLATYSIILCRHTVNGFLRAHTVRTVAVRKRFSALRHGGQFPSVLPRHRHAVAPIQRVSDRIIRDRGAVVIRQQVAPSRVAVGVSGGHAHLTFLCKVTVGVIAVGAHDGRAKGGAQAAERVVGVAFHQCIAVFHRFDPAVGIVGVVQGRVAGSDAADAGGRAAGGADILIGILREQMRIP